MFSIVYTFMIIVQVQQWFKVREGSENTIKHIDRGAGSSFTSSYVQVILSETGAPHLCPAVVGASHPVLHVLSLKYVILCVYDVLRCCLADQRVPILGIIIKQWAKLQGINDASKGTLSSYTLVLMVIRYLQGTRFEVHCTFYVFDCLLCICRALPYQCSLPNTVWSEYGTKFESSLEFLKLPPANGFIGMVVGHLCLPNVQALSLRLVVPSTLFTQCITVTFYKGSSSIKLTRHKVFSQAFRGPRSP